ncbi:hypothetical protein MF271_01170 (plasmid) [Deinococcus sp. KNUC1210]|uniref:hypothetical protein n=1 Tax=Deinococcus sp. KNUC1210 TaxID=2917691 RepID=UPI001EF140CA|nr:hypothetical protein [Deinococcus sp. KNUC1210]ULH13971.1 hypothetical protein MF271_01170 [Deinococcus sp. KNUC1210]
MTDPTITEVLAEGDDQAWITLSDGLTRLVSFQLLMSRPTHLALRLRRLLRCPRLSPDGSHILWPGGTLLDVQSVQQAPNGPLPLELLALVPAAQRYRPLAALLRACDPPLADYLDARPSQVVAARLGLKASEMDSILAGHRPTIPELVVPRLSDLALLLSHLVPGGMVNGLLRRPWPYAQHYAPQNPLLDTALDCLRAGRTDLVEAPLVRLLLPSPNLAGAK